MTKYLNFLSVSPMDRIAGAQKHFGKGFTTGKIIVVAIAIVLVVAFIIYVIKHARK